MGAFITVVMFGIVAPFFWGHILSNPAILEHKITLAQFMLQVFIGNTIYTQLDLCAWIFLYIAIGSGRRIRESEVSNLRLQNSLKEAQLVNLASQLNPHFLFNAINNIRFTIYEDAEKADTMLTGLSEMLRYSLERSKQDKVRLCEELEIIALYIDLIKVQMEDRLVFSLKVAPSLNNYLIPPMTLQLLVENAVKHGIDKLRHGGRIELTAELAEQQLIFKVNNSCGDNKPLLSSEAASNNIGIGLINIQERLRLLYGDKASLHIEQTSNNFSVTLSVPQESGI
jgi:LytS/YehU family sensor histidine kinase